jgi:hypothetical protein
VSDWRRQRDALLESPGGKLEGFATEHDELAVYVLDTPVPRVWLRTGACWRVHVHCPLLPRLAHELAYSLREQADMADAATAPWRGETRVFHYNGAVQADNRAAVYGESCGGPLAHGPGGVVAPFDPRVTVEVIDDAMKDPAARVSYARMDTGTARRCADFLEVAADVAQGLERLHADAPGRVR